MLYREFLKQERECPFCADEKRVIKENDHAFLTYCLAPYHEHHTMAIPKRHVESLDDLTDEESTAVFELAKLATKALKKLGYTNSNVLTRSGDDAQKSIAHLHTHIVPNIALGDVHRKVGARHIMTEEEIEKTMQDISGALSE